MNKYDQCYTNDLLRWQMALFAMRYVCQRARVHESPLQWVAHAIDFELDALQQALARRGEGGRDEAR